jgi:ParB family chromosome partitioning protein
VEKRAKAKPPSERKKRPAPTGAKDADTVSLEGDLSATVGMPVSIEHDSASGAGSVTIRYADLEGLDDLIRLLGGGR